MGAGVDGGAATAASSVGRNARGGGGEGRLRGSVVGDAGAGTTGAAGAAGCAGGGGALRDAVSGSVAVGIACCMSQYKPAPPTVAIAPTAASAPIGHRVLLACMRAAGSGSTR